MNRIINTLDDEKVLNNELEEVFESIKNEYLHAEDMMQSDFICLQDCINIAKKSSHEHPNEKFVVVTAPKGSEVEVAE